MALILVTGAAGFIGSSVSRALLARGDSVIGVDNLNAYYDVTLKDARLKRLEAEGLVTRRFYDDHPPRAEYVLTDKGASLRPVLRALRDWGLEHLGGKLRA
jgi:nucleoside-diphosphate-sugar epimerase